MLNLRTLLVTLAALFAVGAAVETTTAGGGRVVIRRRQPSSRGASGRYALRSHRFAPRRKHLEPAQLRKLLGEHFEPRFMAVERPTDEQPQLLAATPEGRSLEQLRALRTANLSAGLERIAGRRVDPVLLKSFETWMVERSTCPVRYAWEDIGALFWPRFVRRGECASVAGTCSWPAGMHCVPSATRTLHLLRWQCKQPKGSRRKTTAWPQGQHQGPLKCSWIQVPYPITSECMCTC